MEYQVHIPKEQDDTEYLFKRKDVVKRVKWGEEDTEIVKRVKWGKEEEDKKWERIVRRLNLVKGEINEYSTSPD